MVSSILFDVSSYKQTWNNIQVHDARSIVEYIFLSSTHSFSPSHAFFYISLTHLHKQTYGTFVSKDAMMHIIQGNRLDSFFAAFFSFYTILLLLPQISLVIPHSFVDEEKNGQSLTKQATTCKWSKDQM